jgi:hypothetical protein
MQEEISKAQSEREEDWSREWNAISKNKGPRKLRFYLFSGFPAFAGMTIRH